jgi:hypothetical protein
MARPLDATETNANYIRPFALTFYLNVQRRKTMPAFVIPILIGIPVLVGSGYVLIHVLHH